MKNLIFYRSLRSYQTVRLGSSTLFKTPRKKKIYTFGFAFIMIVLLSMLPDAKLRLLIPGEKEKLDRQIEAWNEIEQLKVEIKNSLAGYKRDLSFNDFENTEINWNNNLPGFEALLSLIKSKMNFSIFHLLKTLTYQGMKISNFSTKKNGI